MLTLAQLASMGQKWFQLWKSYRNGGAALLTFHPQDTLLLLTNRAVSHKMVQNVVLRDCDQNGYNSVLLRLLTGDMHLILHFY